MAPLVFNGICRFVVNQAFGGRQVVNVLDMQIDTTGSTMAREDAIEDQAAVILQEWHDSIRPLIADDVSLVNVTWVDMDSLDGITGATASGSGSAVWPGNGSNTGACMPGNVACLVHKNATVSRRKRNGRMYLAGINEAFTDITVPNLINAATVTTLNTALATFLGDINQGPAGAGSYDSQLVVTHTRWNGELDDEGRRVIVANGWDDVDTLTVDQTLATQRRRLRG